MTALGLHQYLSPDAEYVSDFVKNDLLELVICESVDAGDVEA